MKYEAHKTNILNLAKNNTRNFEYGFLTKLTENHKIYICSLYGH